MEVPAFLGGAAGGVRRGGGGGAALRCEAARGSVEGAGCGAPAAGPAPVRGPRGPGGRRCPPAAVQGQSRAAEMARGAAAPGRLRHKGRGGLPRGGR